MSVPNPGSPPTPAEFAETMRSLRSGDEEQGHGAMDRAMCDLLVQLGYVDAVAVFHEQEKWYA